MSVFVPYRGFYFLNQNDSLLHGYNQILVFVPYRGFYFLNAEQIDEYENENNPFSSPIGAFIFLIDYFENHEKESENTVFVPYRGFYFLNVNFSEFVAYL